jgi:hypothetical protein
MGGDFALAWDYLLPLIILGFSIGVVLAIVFGFARIGWKLAPYIVGGVILVWFFS